MLNRIIVSFMLVIEKPPQGMLTLVNIMELVIHMASDHYIRRCRHWFEMTLNTQGREGK